MIQRLATVLCIVSTVCLAIFLTVSKSESQTGRALELQREGMKFLAIGNYKDAITGFRKMEASCGADEYCLGEALFYQMINYLVVLFKKGELFC